MKTLLTILALVASVARAADQDPAEKRLFDARKAEKAEAVLRVKPIGGGAGSKYILCKVKVLGVFKNKTESTFKDREIRLAYYSFGAGLPGKECTIYITHYNKGNPKAAGLWKLVERPGLGPDHDPGFSHVAK